MKLNTVDQLLILLINLWMTRWIINYKLLKKICEWYDLSQILDSIKRLNADLNTRFIGDKINHIFLLKIWVYLSWPQILTESL